MAVEGASSDKEAMTKIMRYLGEGYVLTCITYCRLGCPVPVYLHFKKGRQVMTMTNTRRPGHGSAAGQLNEDEFIQEWIAELAADLHTRFDPDILVKTIYRDRLAYGAPDPVQTRNYVLHCVRLAPHVCRHALHHGVYEMHTAPECSDICKQAWQRKQEQARGPLCTECFTYAAANGACSC